jgi:regulator of sigma E protease
MLSKIAIFILFLGPLVFFHELGHYLFARFFGVRVEVFSIGFGPKLFKFKKGYTEYVISLIPLGGYVKMFGDDALNKDKIPEEDRNHSFSFKSKWARFWIVFGGPLANFIMAYVIFFFLLMGGERAPEIRLGLVNPSTSFFAKGIRTGDTLKKVNGRIIATPSDIIMEGNGEIRTVTVDRLGEAKQIQLDMNGETFFQNLAKHPPVLRKPLVVDRNGDIYGISLKSDSVDWNMSLDSFPIAGKAGQVSLFKLKPNQNVTASVIFTEEASSKQFSLSMNSIEDMEKSLESLGFYSLDLAVKSVNMQSPADKAGIRAGDVIAGLAGVNLYSFDQLRKTLQKSTGEVDVVVYRKGQKLDFKLVPDIKKINEQEVKLIGVYSNGVYQAMKYVTTPSKGLVKSFTLSFARTWEAIDKTFEGFTKLITGQAPFKSIGGPLTIGQVASDSFNTSLSYFFQLMALISVNLGIINLFPIPVLDGGHILFIFLEIINRGPISRRKMEIAQQFGLSLLLLLMVGAIFNDFTRIF